MHINVYTEKAGTAPPYVSNVEIDTPVSLPNADQLRALAAFVGAVVGGPMSVGAAALEGMARAFAQGATVVTTEHASDFPPHEPGEAVPLDEDPRNAAVVPECCGRIRCGHLKERHRADGPHGEHDGVCETCDNPDKCSGYVPPMAPPRLSVVDQ